MEGLQLSIIVLIVVAICFWIQLQEDPEQVAKRRRKGPDIFDVVSGRVENEAKRSVTKHTTWQAGKRKKKLRRKP